MTSEKDHIRRTVVLISVLLLLFGGGAVLLVLRSHQNYYPHGMRAGKLPTFMLSLSAYAQDHDGWYPRGGASPLESLQKLYPEYAVEGLAGLSGSEKATLERLNLGGSIDSSVSSWTYVPDYREDDDPRICIIWENKAGIFVNGSRSDGHAVGFVGGDTTKLRVRTGQAF